MPDVLSLELGGGSTCIWNSTVSEHAPWIQTVLLICSFTTFKATCYEE